MNSKKMAKARFWSFTDYKETVNYPKFKDDCPTFAVWQLEKCPKTSKLHIQGHIEFKYPVSLSYAKKTLSFSTHLKPTRERFKSIYYCMKEETRVSGPFFFGITPKETLVNQLSKIDDSNLKIETSEEDKKNLTILKKIINEGKTEEEIAFNYYPLFKKYKDVLKLFVINRKSEEDEIFSRAKLILIQGVPGSGKSTLTNVLVGNRNLKKYNYNGKKWFDGYSGEPVLHMDEINRGSFTVTEINNLVDGYTKRGETKGGHVHLSIKEIFMISNYPFETWVPVKSKESLNALHRRADLLFYFDFEVKESKKYCVVKIVRKEPEQGGRVTDELVYRYLFLDSFHAVKKLADVLLTSPILKDSFFFPKDFVHKKQIDDLANLLEKTF